MFRHTANLAAQRRALGAQWKSLLIGAFAVGAIFLGLELTRKPAPKPLAAARPASVTVPVVQPAVSVDEEIVVPEAANSVAAATVPVPTPSPTAVPAEVTPTAPTASELLAKEKNLILSGLDAGREYAISRDKALFNQALEGKAWAAYRDLLGRSIAPELAKISPGTGLNRYDSIWSTPALYQAFLRWQVIGKLTPSAIASKVVDRYSGDALTWVCFNNTAMEELTRTIQPQDDPAKVMQFLMDAWPNTPEDKAKYFPLVLACAVVFDHEVRIPNPIAASGKTSTKSSSSSSISSASVVDPLERLMWYIKNNEKGRLAAPVHHSSASDLVWVVCAPVSTSELDWAISKLHMNRKNWGNTYGEVKYLMERAVKGLNPYKEYSFAEILKEGGICGDQSYFSANTARAQGIPAMILTGETDLGGHAWVGLKFKDNEWTTGVGRIGGVSKGQTGNPQTGASITEQEVQLWNDRYHQSPGTSLSVARHLWLAGFFDEMGKSPENADAVRLANRIGQSFPETWAALYKMLVKETKIAGEPAVPSNLEEWKNFAKSMRREFKDNPRMAQLASNAEMEYIFPYGDAMDATRTLLRERRRIERNSGEQKDLIAESLKRQADLIAKRAEPTATRDISTLYDSALRKYGGSITGFKMMAEDYFGFCKANQELAHKAARDIELAFKRVVETGSTDWFRAKTESDIYRMICGYYRAAGDEDRAVLLEKRYQVLLRRAERGAL